MYRKIPSRLYRLLQGQDDPVAESIKSFWLFCGLFWLSPGLFPSAGHFPRAEYLGLDHLVAGGIAHPNDVADGAISQRLTLSGGLDPLLAGNDAHRLAAAHRSCFAEHGGVEHLIWTQSAFGAETDYLLLVDDEAALSSADVDALMLQVSGLDDLAAVDGGGGGQYRQEQVLTGTDRLGPAGLVGAADFQAQAVQGAGSPAGLDNPQGLTAGGQSSAVGQRRDVEGEVQLLPAVAFSFLGNEFFQVGSCSLLNLSSCVVGGHGRRYQQNDDQGGKPPSPASGDAAEKRKAGCVPIALIHLQTHCKSVVGPAARL